MLRHPHLHSFLVRCHNPSAVFLPVKSPSPPRKVHKQREAKLKQQRDLLPLFDENTCMQYPQLETKRVDPTSFSGKISHDTATDCNVDDQEEKKLEKVLEDDDDDETEPRREDEKLDESKCECEVQRADALESLLEDKFDELSGLLKPFGEDAVSVSSRHTAIWLTKSLMDAHES